MQEKISVIVPVYGVEKFLDKCVESIVNQTYKNLEIILVDDGSPDNSPKICDEWASKDSRIKVIHKQNGGVSSARNVGLKAATGEYVCFVDSDDTVTAEYVNALFELITKNGAELSSVTFDINKENMDEKIELSVELVNITLDESKIFLNHAIMGGPCCKLFKTDIIKSNNISFPLDIHYGEDAVFVFSYMQYCKKLVYSNKRLYFYQTQNSVATKKYWPDMYIYLKRVFETYKELLVKINANEKIVNEILGGCSTSYFKNIMNRNVSKKNIISYFKEYLDAYEYFSPYFAHSFLNDNSAIKKEIDLLVKKRKYRYFLYMYFSAAKRFIKKRIFRKGI